jgi:4-methylaminobutanoate oxidase (formaldehyde-forming)
MLAGGYRAIDALRLEKGYRVWAADITPETTPYEAGLGFAVRLNKQADFIGKEALQRAKGVGAARVLRPLLLDDSSAIAQGGEPVFDGDRVVGRVTSGGYGFTLAASIAYAYLPGALAAPGTRLSVEVFGEPIGANVAAEPLWDPKGARVRA